MSDLVGNPRDRFSSRHSYINGYVGLSLLTAKRNCWFCHGQAYYLSRLVGKPTMWFPTRSDTNRAVQSQEQARSLKFRIKVEEELYYPSSENKGTDQLRGYREADLRLCFRLCRLLVFPWGGSYINGYAGLSLLTAMRNCWFCHGQAYLL